MASQLMRSKLIALVPWMATFAAGQDLPQPAEVHYGYAGTLRGAAYQVGEECFVNAAETKTWGWNVSFSRFEAKVEAEGRVVRVPYRIQNGREVLPLGQIARQLGASTAWRMGTGKYEVWSTLTQVKVGPQGVSIDAAFPVKAKLAQLSNPPRAVIDLLGARIEPYSQIELPANARISQIKPDVVRIVVESDRAFTMTDAIGQPFRGADIRFGGAIPANVPEELAAPVRQEPPVPPITLDDEPESMPFDLHPPVGPVPPVIVGPVEVQQDGAVLTLLRIPISRPLSAPPKIGRSSPGVIRVVLPGARYVVAENHPGYVGAVKAVAFENHSHASAVEIELSRPMGLEVSYSPSEIRLVLIKPNVGNGKLAGKTVVVDAGHGGHDSGARSPDKKTLEKDLTLKIATKLASTLAAEGATVIMTRKTDVFIPLKERSDIANRNGADFFISVHINSNRAANSSTGQISFYHAKDPIGMLLAECIQGEMAKASKLKSIGVWTDQKIYSTGFAVLRYATMPAVLLEMGFINHSGDRARMTSAEFPGAMANAILRGLRIFLGDVKAK